MSKHRRARTQGRRRKNSRAAFDLVPRPRPLRALNAPAAVVVIVTAVLAVAGGLFASTGAPASAHSGPPIVLRTRTVTIKPSGSTTPTATATATATTAPTTTTTSTTTVSPSTSSATTATTVPTTSATSSAPAPSPLVSDDFADLAGWYKPYNGAGAYAQQGARLAANTQVANGVLSVYARPVTTTTVIGTKTLAPGDYAAGGIMQRTPLYPGSRISMDLRMSASVGTRGVALLWPEGSWPAAGEFDFVEDGADMPDRQATAITNHWYDATRVSSSNPAGNAQRVIDFGPHDFTTWSHVEVLWTSTLFVVTVNGVEVARYTDHIPTGPMHLVIQTAVAGGGQSPTLNGVSRTPGAAQVRSLRVYPA